MKPEIWDQIKNITADETIKALEKDGWKLAHKNYGHDMIKDLFQDIGWDEADLKRLKLIK